MADSTFLIKLGLNTDQLVAGINKSNQLLSGFQNQLKSFQTAIIGGLGFYSLAQAAVGAVEKLATFEHAMSEVKAITGATGEDFTKLRDNALQLAGAFQAIDIVHLETEFGRLGFSTKEIINSTQATIDLAAATGSDLASSAVIAGSTLRAFNLDAKEMGRVADVMAGALNRTGLDMSNFGESIKYVAPNAYAANVSLEETAALLGILADNGIKGSMAGTTLRRILQDLSKDGRPLVERLQELSDRGLDVSGAMDEVGRIGSTGLLILTKNIDRVDSLTTSLNHVTGEVKAMSKVMQDNLIGDWNKFTAELERTIQKGSFLNDVFRGLLGAATEFVRIAQNPWTFFDAPVNDAIVLWNNLFSTDKVKEFNIELANSAKIFKTINDQLNKDNGPLTPAQMGAIGEAQMASRRKKAKEDYAGIQSGMGSAGVGDSTGSSEEMLAKMQINEDYGNSLDNVLKGIADDASNAEQAFNGFDSEVKTAANGLMSLHEDVSPDVQATFDGIVDGVMKSQNAMSSLTGHMKSLGTQIRQSVVAVGNTIGNSLGDAITGMQSFGQAMAQIIDQVISQLENLAIAYIITAATKDAAFLGGPGGVLAAIAGIAIGAGLIHAAFRGISSGGGGGSTGGGASIQQSTNGGLQPGSFRIDGRDLVYAYDLNKQYDKTQKG